MGGLGLFWCGSCTKETDCTRENIIQNGKPRYPFCMRDKAWVLWREKHKVEEKKPTLKELFNGSTLDGFIERAKTKKDLNEYA